MELFDAIYQRRAIKAFDPEHIISADDEKKLFEAAIQAPTSFNIQHWRFVVVRDKVLRAEMRKLGNDQTQITDSSLLVIMTADMKAWQKDPSRYWVQAPKEVADLLVGWMGPFHDGRDWLQRDEAQRSIGMAMQTLMLAAKGIGLDSCPMIGFDIEAVAKLINLPADHVMGPMVAIGKGTKAPWPKPGQLSLDEVLVNNTF
ncbi:MAG: nitroreductase family protein [Limnobacter sp.]|jgi:nitroreductase|uniref:Nitroreductase family protein n=1 Tax=Limnobacter profundi TaxID=2732163 RepID=A0ABX6N3G3_9BURK|nr:MULTISPECIES: nitroreductase family protein [unclassified Limnobacter]MAG81988.1 reductase DrgA [Sutterellaceae bacterium]MBA4315942.1 nitroreductase family protein [Alcaligenaceae bacterium]PZO16495.1 MAG: nitroreductase family protein [Betaproteobacteria bacterium]MBT84065.1 reductase DrgA [Sutterellaceae bacterium]PZO20498.1 MAG: nitroreductase family protein [Betaproteobacteria bacterium]|tara:strand:+ start:11708 stop:12310 length:603 start_codon:yes stop_codon:yes gene_type:complete